MFAICKLNTVPTIILLEVGVTRLSATLKRLEMQSQLKNILEEELQLTMAQSLFLGAMISKYWIEENLTTRLIFFRKFIESTHCQLLNCYKS